MIRRPPRSTRTDTLFPTRRSSDLAKRDAAFVIARGLSIGGCDPAASQRRQARIGTSRLPFRRPMDRQRIVAGDNDGSAQAIERQPLRQFVGARGLAVDQDVHALGPAAEIEQGLAPSGQERKGGGVGKGGGGGGRIG